MAVALMIELEGMNETMYQELCDRVDLRDDPPEGLIFHAAGPGRGGWRIMDVWDTQDHWDIFFAETVGPVLDAIARDAGYDALERSSVMRWELETYSVGPGPLVNAAGL